MHTPKYYFGNKLYDAILYTLVSTVPVKRSPHTSGDSTSSCVWKQTIDLQPGEMVSIVEHLLC